MPATMTAPVHADSGALSFNAMFLHGLKRTMGYAELLLKDIPADKFAHMPHPTMNHPAFIIGHLSLYPNRLFNAIGRKDLVRDQPGYPELFQAGVACVQQDGRYPAKQEIVGQYTERYGALAEALPSIPPEVFHRDNPLEGRMKEVFPIIGLMFNFIINNHHMMHLGQVSAWRRSIGLGSVM